MLQFLLSMPAWDVSVTSNFLCAASLGIHVTSMERAMEGFDCRQAKLIKYGYAKLLLQI